MGVGAAAAEMATLETRKFENASPREEHPSVPGNNQSTTEVQQVRRDSRDSTEKGVVLTQVMEQDVEEVREKSGEDVTIRMAKEVRQRPTTLTMDPEDRQKKCRSQNMTGKPRSGEGGGGEVNTAMQRTTQHRRRKQPARSGPRS